ncbi:hypothetical protein [Microtetraspora malaysiensis]
MPRRRPVSALPHSAPIGAQLARGYRPDGDGVLDVEQPVVA